MVVSWLGLGEDLLTVRLDHCGPQVRHEVDELQRSLKELGIDLAVGRVPVYSRPSGMMGVRPAYVDRYTVPPVTYPLA